MIKKISIIMLLALCLWVFTGSTVLAVGGGFDAAGNSIAPDGALVQCGRGGADPQSCDFAAAIDMVNRLITYLIFISVPIAAIAFAYAGWLYLSSGGDSGKVTQARKIFTSVGIGFIIILSAWLIFKFIATTFLDPLAGYGTYLN
jgi:hypothetical protein